MELIFASWLPGAPSTSGKVNIFKKSVSTKLPSMPVNLFSPAVNRKPSVSAKRDVAATSG